MNDKFTIAVVDIVYVGMSQAPQLSQHNKVYAVDIVPDIVEKINKCISPNQDKKIEEYLATSFAECQSLLDDYSNKLITSLKKGLSNFAKWYSRFYLQKA